MNPEQSPLAEQAPAFDMAQTRNLIFLGGIFLPEQAALIERNSRVNVQYAADALQKAVLRGVSQHTDVSATVVSLPFIASFPRGDRVMWFPATTNKLFAHIPVLSAGFLNLMVLRLFSRYRAARTALNKLLAVIDGQTTIVVYSAHLPFTLAAIATKRQRRDIRICLFLPDFPEFMGQGGIVYRTLVRMNTWAFYKLAPRFDYFVVLTAPMAERLGIGADKHIVFEGVFDPSDETEEPEWPADPGPTFIYTGTLAARYGILDLLHAFENLNNTSAKLWICGDGDARDAVEDLARLDPRVTFHGRVPRAQALALQAKAHVMVNPRRPEGEFTRYSFPSKTMEYLASGRPVIMHWLPGMPAEYRPFLMCPPTADAAGLAAMMQRVADMPADALQGAGGAGRQFILQQKNPKVQVARLLTGLFGTGKVPAEGPGKDA